MGSKDDMAYSHAGFDQFQKIQNGPRRENPSTNLLQGLVQTVRDWPSLYGSPIMYVYCDDCSNGPSNPGDSSSDPDEQDTGIGGSAEPDGAGAGDNGGRAFHGSTGRGILRQMGQNMLSWTSHLSMTFLHLSLSRQWNTWLQERVRTSSWAARLYWHMAQL